MDPKKFAEIDEQIKKLRGLLRSRLTRKCRVLAGRIYGQDYQRLAAFDAEIKNFSIEELSERVDALQKQQEQIPPQKEINHVKR